TGAVCGVVVASKNAARPDGALAIHWSAVTEDIGEVLAANRDFQLTDLRWQEAYRDSRTAAESEAPAAQQTRLQSYLSAARATPAPPPPPPASIYDRDRRGARSQHRLSPPAARRPSRSGPVGWRRRSGTGPGTRWQPQSI